MQAWEDFLATLEKELGSEVVQKWLHPLKILSFDAGNLYLEAKDYFQALWFEEHVRPKIKEMFFNQNHRLIKVHLSIANNTAAQESPPKSKKRSPLGTPSSFELSFNDLDPLYTFEHYLLNEENQVVDRLAAEIVGHSFASPKDISGALNLTTYNPLFIYGPKGSGKTHLLMAMAHTLKSKQFNAIYCRAETFTEHVVGAIRAGEMSTFRRAYRHADVLLIDDVHVFSRKGATQEEFFHTFNTLHLAGKQVVLTAHCPPQELQLIEPRLVSRFEWGIVLPLQCITEKERATFVKMKAQALHLHLEDKVIEFLITAFNSTPKALAGAVEALALRLHLNGSSQGNRENSPSLAFVKHHLADLISEEEKNAITAEKVIETIANYYNVLPKDLLGDAQTRDCSLPRQMAMYVCRYKLKMPFMKIGHLFTRDHSTVMSSIKRIQNEYDGGDKEIMHAISSIISSLNNK